MYLTIITSDKKYWHDVTGTALSTVKYRYSKLT